MAPILSSSPPVGEGSKIAVGDSSELPTAMHSTSQVVAVPSATPIDGVMESCDCYCCSLIDCDPEELAYLETFEYLVPYDKTPKAIFKACREAFTIVSVTVEKLIEAKERLADHRPLAWLEDFRDCIDMAEENNYYPELDMGTQTICWLGVILAGGKLSSLEKHIDKSRVKLFGYEMLNDIRAYELFM